MGQIKYLIYACLIVAISGMGFIFFSKFFSAQIVAPQSSIIDYDTSTKINTSIVSKGKSLFQQNCQTCHLLDKNSTGPALRGVEERGPWTDRKNLIKWIKNPAAFIPATPYTKRLKEEYGQIMPSFPDLSAEDIHSIFDYITKPLSYSMPVALNNPCLKTKEIAFGL